MPTPGRGHSFIDLTGQKFNRLLVKERIKSNSWRTKWLCLCDCGKEVGVFASHLKNGHTKSYGCFSRERTIEVSTTHNMTHTRLYITYRNMLSRCCNSSTNEYKRYGGRGIKVCDERINSFENFCEWARESGYNDDLTIERKDYNGNYEPKNCTWIPPNEQAANTRHNINVAYKNKVQNLHLWAIELGIFPQTIYNRYHRGVREPEKLLSFPVKRGVQNNVQSC